MKNVIGFLKIILVHFVISRISEAGVLLNFRLERVLCTKAQPTVSIISEFRNVKHLILALLDIFSKDAGLFRQDLSLGDGQLVPLLAVGQYYTFTFAILFDGYPASH